MELLAEQSGHFVIQTSFHMLKLFIESLMWLECELHHTVLVLTKTPVAVTH